MCPYLCPSALSTNDLNKITLHNVFFTDYFSPFFFGAQPHDVDFAPFYAAAYLLHHKQLLTDLKSGSTRQNCTMVRRGFCWGLWVFVCFFKITAFLDITSYLMPNTMTVLLLQARGMEELDSRD